MLVLRTFYSEVFKHENGCVIKSTNPHVIKSDYPQEYFGFGCVYKVIDFIDVGDDYHMVTLSDGDFIAEVSKESAIIGEHDMIYQAKELLFRGEVLADAIV